MACSKPPAPLSLQKEETLLLLVLLLDNVDCLLIAEVLMGKGMLLESKRPERISIAR